MNQYLVVAATALRLPGVRTAMSTSPSQASLSLVVGHSRRDTSDEDLVRGLVASEVWAIAETWHRFAPMVTVMAERCLGSRSEAEDICQEVFFLMLRRAKTLREPDRLRSFIYSFAVRAVRSALRRKKLRGWLSFEEPETLADLNWETPDVESRDLLRRFHRLLDRLAPRDRLVFILRRMESMTVEEIARTMDISESTVKRSMTHASDRLSSWMDADPGLCGLVDRLRGVR
jgi:RNA polymerase sigma-70 factor, ECF subfamily